MSTPKVKQKKTKKWIMSGEDDEKTVVAFGGTPGKDRKIIIKALEKGINEHFTMMVSARANYGFLDTD